MLIASLSPIVFHLRNLIRVTDDIALPSVLCGR